MKRMKTVLKVLQASGAKLAELDRKLAVLQEERSHTQETHDAGVERFIIDTVRRNGITKLPIGDIVAGLDRLAKPADVQPANYGQSATTLPQPESAFPSAQASETTIEAFVKMSNNASEENRQKLKGAGLHWSGKEGGFVGKIGLAALEQLRVQFPDRVLRPALAAVQNQGSIAIPGMAELTESPSAGAVDAPGVVAQPDEPGKVSAPDQSGKNGDPTASNGLGPSDNADAPPASTPAPAPRTPASPFRGFSQRKSGAPSDP
jgi:hypothetical protein